MCLIPSAMSTKIAMKILAITKYTRGSLSVLKLFFLILPLKEEEEY